MRCRNTLLLIIFLIFGFNISMLAQEAGGDQPEIGKPCPDFVLKNVQYHSKKELSLKQLKGKNVILDFFSSGCSSCVEAFPKTNRLYEEFKGQDLEIILVGKEDARVRPMYEKFRQKQNLKLPVVFDSALCHRWVSRGYPHLIWIDKNGIVKAITSSPELKKENVSAFLEGRDFVYYDVSDKANQERESAATTQMEEFNLDDADVLAASILSDWNGKSRPRILDAFATGRRTFDSRCMTLARLYSLAYVGKTDWIFSDSLYTAFNKQPILEIADKTRFKYDFSASKNLYNYCLVVPKENANRGYMQELLKKDLEKTFGYKVTIETRKFPAWILTATKQAREKLKTKGGKPTYDGVPWASFKATNFPVSGLIGKIWAHHQSGPVFFNETGIEGNIDINLDCVMTDIEAIKKELSKKGLDLVLSEREMKTLVIRDPVDD